MGTRGGRPEPQAVTGRTPGGSRNKNAARPAASRPPRPAAPRPAPPPPEPAGEPNWFRLLTLLLSLLGLGVSVYLTITHYTEAAPAGCPENATFNCVKVTTSPESVVFGIFPVAVLGLAFYAFMTAINTPWAWRAQWPPVRWARLAAAITGVGFILYLIYVELFVVNAICLWCTSVHVVTFLLFALIVASAAIWGLSRPAAGSE